jgi:hypothetical protein
MASLSLALPSENDLHALFDTYVPEFFARGSAIQLPLLKQRTGR